MRLPLPLFESAFTVAVAAGQQFIAADAAHMAALAAPDRDAFLAWTERGVELAEASQSARYWIGPLLNNLGGELLSRPASSTSPSTRSSAPSPPASTTRRRLGDRPRALRRRKGARTLDRSDEAIAQLELAVESGPSAPALPTAGTTR